MSKRTRTILISLVIATVITGIALFFFFNVDHREEDEAEGNPAAWTETKIELPPVENNAFSVGEKLHYNVIYKGITVGHASIEVIDGPIINDRPTLKYVTTAQSTKFFDNFFKVRDKNISTIDKASMFAVAFDQSLHEGKYRAQRHHIFDYPSKKFSSSETRKGVAKNKEGPLEAPVHDVLSALYYVRTLPLKPGRDLTLTIFRNNTGKQIPVRIDAETKELKTALGRIPCLRVEPMIQGDSLFKSEGSKLVVWMTNDERKLPVLMEATIGVGLVRVKLNK